MRTENFSKFEQTDLNGLTLLKDEAIGFSNQIWGINNQTLAHLPDALALYAKINKSPELDIGQIELTPKVKAHLASLNFEIVETLNFLSIKCADITTIATDVEVMRLRQDDADLFLELLKTSGMQTSDKIWQLKKHLYCTDMFRCFVAKIDGIPCALATNYIDGSFGLLANAFTQPKFQKNGCQTAMLNARLQDAKKLGLSQLIVDVVPNTVSERNCLKLGFRPYETRYILQKVDKKLLFCTHQNLANKKPDKIICRAWVI